MHLQILYSLSPLRQNEKATFENLKMLVFQVLKNQLILKSIKD
jgi:hypothetical protein